MPTKSTIVPAGMEKSGVAACIDLMCLYSWANQLLEVLNDADVSELVWDKVRRVREEMVECHYMALEEDVAPQVFDVDDRDGDSPAIGNDDEPTPFNCALRITGAPITTSKQPESSSSACSRSSTAIPSGKKRQDVVPCTVIDEKSSKKLPFHVRWFLDAVHDERARTFNPKRKGTTMPKVDVVVAKDDVYYFAAGWLAFFVDNGRFANYKDARAAMTTAIGKCPLLSETGDEEDGLDAIKAGNKSMWMVTRESFLKHLSWKARVKQTRG
ncbi:hypothetical protein GGF31_003479 [Allomyces arbusculus]|nr:hypothetical protein GGF31_003479 [Allomyces arbusculus]